MKRLVLIGVCCLFISPSIFTEDRVDPEKALPSDASRPSLRPPGTLEGAREKAFEEARKRREEKKLRRLIQDEIKKLQGEILTTYSTGGEPIYQSQDSKGWHRQLGAVKLEDGLATINLNTSPSEGKQDVSYMADSTYRGVAWSLDSANTKTYWIIPLSATEALIKSSDNTDTATVKFLLEGT